MENKVAQQASILPDISKEYLIKRAIEARENAHAPYSKFRVGAALLTNAGVFLGANIENASYGATICAERSAVAAAVSSGAREFYGLAVATDMEDPAMPCGICQQFMVEFFPPGMPSLIANLKGKVIEINITDLLPGAFREFKA